MSWVLAANQVRHSTDTAYHDVSPAPRLVMIIAQLCQATLYLMR